MGFEPTTSCLGSKHSTTELRPPAAPNTILTIIHQGRKGKTPVFSACVGIGGDLSAWPRRVGAHSRARRGTGARVCAGENCAGTGGQGARLCAPTWEFQHTLRIPFDYREIRSQVATGPSFVVS